MAEPKVARTGVEDPYLAFNYAVEIEGIVVGGFSEVTGLQMEIEVQDYREGGENSFIHKLPGPLRYPSRLILKRGMMSVDDLTIWQELTTLYGFMEPKSISVIMLDQYAEEVRRWDFEAAIPVRWSGPELRGTTNAVAIETLEFVHNGVI